MSEATDLNDICTYIALDDDLFLPRGVYKIEKGVPIIPDSGCTHVFDYAASIFYRLGARPACGMSLFGSFRWPQSCVSISLLTLFFLR